MYLTTMGKVILELTHDDYDKELGTALIAMLRMMPAAIATF